MYDLTQEIPPEKYEELIQNIAREVVKRGLEVPAILFLEMHKPLTYIASQGVVVLTPFLAPFFGFENIRIASILMEKRENVESLIRHIEDMSENLHHPSGSHSEQTS